MRNLFSWQEEKPLAERARPAVLDQYIGQQHLVGKGKLLRRLIEEDKLTSMIFYGPPGTGKTTLASIISNMTEAKFVKMNAVETGLKDVRKMIEQAERWHDEGAARVIIHIDEIHRFNRTVQDALLPVVEAGRIILIGSTTENPYHSIIPALLSRARVFQLQPLTEEEIAEALRRVLDSDAKLKEMRLSIEEAAVRHLAKAAAGDLRIAYQALEMAAFSARGEADIEQSDKGKITLGLVEEALQTVSLRMDENEYYDRMSAFIKSIRGSDTDAALFYFASMVESGVDVMAILRRMAVHASEDVGMASPQALVQVIAAKQAFEFIGWPEARIPIAQAIIFLCESPKSNSVIQAIDQAFEAVRRFGQGSVPLHLRDAHYRGAKALGVKGYRYPHDYPNHYVKQQYMPDHLPRVVFYHPSDQGYEAKIRLSKERRDSD